MAFEDYKAEIAILLSQVDNDPGDVHEIHMRLHALLNTLRAEGLPIPDDLRDLEDYLDRRFSVTDGEDGDNSGGKDG